MLLNTFAKVADGAPLNDLDVVLVEAFEAHGLGGDMKEHGQLYAGMSPALRTDLFPGAFATLPNHADHMLSDLARDLPGLDAAVRGMPNATDVDVVGVHRGTVHLGDSRRPSREVTTRHGGELLRVVAADNARAARDASTDPFRIKATRFHCTEETGVSWLGGDEVYWIFGSVGTNGQPVTSRSHTFEDSD